MNSDFTKWLKTEETLDAKNFGQPIYSVNDMEKAFNAGKKCNQPTVEEMLVRLSKGGYVVLQSKTSAENAKLMEQLAYIRAENEALKNEIIMKCYPQEYIQQRNGKIKLFLLVCHDLEKNPADLPGKSGELFVAIKEPHRLYTRVAKYSVATGFDCDDVIAWADKPEL